jgi:mRNA interferase RelE/StbE
VKQVVYSREASRFLGRAPVNLRRLIQLKCEAYAANPDSLRNNVKALKGMPGSLRLRIGDWRVVFKEDRQTITVIRIAPRGSAYD